MRGIALDEAAGRESFAGMVLRLWRGSGGTKEEVGLVDACLVASIDHGPLSPSALVTRTIASTRSGAMSGIAGGMLAFSDYHGAAVSGAMRILSDAPSDKDKSGWADDVFVSERSAGRRLPGIGHRWHSRDLRSERLLELGSHLPSGSRAAGAMRALAKRVASHSGNPAPVNIDGALAVSLTALQLDPVYGDLLFALSRGFGLAAHYVEEEKRQLPMRTIAPTRAKYDGIDTDTVGTCES